MTEADLNKQHYVKTLKPVSSMYVNTLCPEKELEILEDFCIVNNWNSVSVSEQKKFRAYLDSTAENLGMELEKVFRGY